MAARTSLREKKVVVKAVELELELIQSHLAQKPMLRGEGKRWGRHALCWAWVRTLSGVRLASGSPRAAAYLFWRLGFAA